MCDLIDLSSPDNRSGKGSELPTPLIPVPENILSDNSHQSQPQVLEFVGLESRKSMDNNPFDMVLRKTSEYVNKSEDPFEVVYEKAMTADVNRKIDFIDDYRMNKKRHSHVLKMNKTLDSLALPSEFSLAPESICIKKSTPSIYIEPATPEHVSQILNHSALNDNLPICRSPSRFSFGKIPSSPSSGDLSILNQSAMNDSLSTSNGSSEDGLLKSFVAHRISMCIQKGTMDAEMMDVRNPTNDRLHRLRRSFSQGDGLSPRKYKIHEAHTIVGNLQNSILEDEEMPTTFFDDAMNQAFLPQVKVNGMSCDSCDISPITKFSSVTSSVSSASPDETVNRAFIDWPLSGSNKLRTQGSAGSNISDLLSQFNHFKKSSNGSNSTEYFSLDDEKFDTNGQTGDQLADGTSDSVFLKNDCGRKTILNEAKSLAQTFEELAANSSPDSRNETTFNEGLPDRLPSSCGASIEVDTVSEDLIKLEPSPVKLSTGVNISATNERVHSEERNEQKISNDIKELENELLGPEKKLEAATLLMNLEKLVKTENNSEAIKLLENLEKVLGVKCQSNTELLAICLQDTISFSEKSSYNESEMESVGRNTDGNIHVVPSENVKNSSCENIMNLEEPIKNLSKSLTTAKAIQNADGDLNLNVVNQKLVMEIKIALDQLVTRLNDEPAILLKNSNKVSSADEESVKNNLQSSVSPMKKISSSPRKSGVPYRSVKSLSRQSIDSSSKNKPIDRSLKRRSFTPLTSESPITSTAKLRIDSPKKEVKRRQNSSDPGAINTLRKTSEPALKMKTSLPVVTKFPKKGNEPLSKRGPLKAVIPLGSMQRGNSFIKKPAPTVSPTTPKKLTRKIPAALKIVTSTPDPNIPMTINCSKTSPKRKPVASSTPDNGTKTWRTKIQVPQSPKHSTSWNISPVTPSAPTSLSGSPLNSSKCQRKVSTGSPRSQPVTPRKLGRSMTRVFNKSSLPSNSSNTPTKKTGKGFHSPRSEPLEKKDARIVQASPLKDSNGSAKPLSFISKLRRGSAGSQKENKHNY